MEYNFLINQAFAKIFVVASCSAIALWSFMIVKNRALPIAIGIYGLLLGPVLVIAMLSGGLSLDVHGFDRSSLPRRFGLSLSAFSYYDQRRFLPA